MKIFKHNEDKIYTPDSIMYIIGRIIGYALMFGGGIVIGQFIRGIIIGLMIVNGR